MHIAHCSYFKNPANKEKCFVTEPVLYRNEHLTYMQLKYSVNLNMLLSCYRIQNGKQQSCKEKSKSYNECSLEVRLLFSTSLSVKQTCLIRTKNMVCYDVRSLISIVCIAGYRENNFPPLPKKCPCKPCFYHDISIDIPIEYQKTCKALFFRWQGETFLFIKDESENSIIFS